MMRDVDFMDIAETFAKKSHCQSFQVGAVAVRDGRIIATGINGTPEGTVNCDEVFGAKDGTQLWRETHSAWSDVHEVHAEQNIIALAARKGIPLEGATVYTTLEPCPHCLKLMVATKIARVVFKDDYVRSNWKKSNLVPSWPIVVEQLKGDE